MKSKKNNILWCFDYFKMLFKNIYLNVLVNVLANKTYLTNELLFLLLSFWCLFNFSVLESFNLLFKIINDPIDQSSYFLKLNVLEKLWLSNWKTNVCVPSIEYSFCYFNPSVRIIGKSTKVPTSPSESSSFIWLSFEYFHVT